jgi:hypothetical protein
LLNMMYASVLPCTTCMLQGEGRWDTALVPLWVSQIAPHPAVFVGIVLRLLGVVMPNHCVMYFDCWLTRMRALKVTASCRSSDAPGAWTPSPSASSIGCYGRWGQDGRYSWHELEQSRANSCMCIQADLRSTHSQTKQSISRISNHRSVVGRPGQRWTTQMAALQ